MKTFKLDGEISWFDYDCAWGRIIGPGSVQNWLKSLKEGETATIEINSPGGDVISGLAIANSIKNSKAHIKAHVVGIAASMASVVACACDEIVMEESAFIMIHNPWCSAEGDANTLRHKADVLDSMKDSLVAFYRGKFGGTPDDLKKMMDEETWMNGREAQCAGFLCEVVSTDMKIAATVTEKMWAKAPAAARKFMNEKALPEDLAKKITSGMVENHEFGQYLGADAEQEKSAGEVETTETAENADEAESVEIDETPFTQVEGAADELEKARAQAAEWEARYKGACRAINERDQLAHRIELANGNLELIGRELEVAVKDKNDLQDQLAKVRNELEKAKADFSSVMQRAETAEKELAVKGEQLERLNKAHRLLTGGVLTPANEETPEESKAREIKNARSAAAREAIREKYKNAVRK